MHKDLYNAALANRKTQYQHFNHSVDYSEQQNSLPAFKEVWPEYKRLNSMSLQATLKRVDYAFQRFFNGLSKYPRFKSVHKYSGWTYPDARQGFKVKAIGDNGYLALTDLGFHAPLRGKARTWGTPTSCKTSGSKRKRQKTRLNRSILDVGIGGFRQAIKYKVEEAGGMFVEVPTKKVKPSQTCPKCLHQKKKDSRTAHTLL